MLPSCKKQNLGTISFLKKCWQNTKSKILKISPVAIFIALTEVSSNNFLTFAIYGIQKLLNNYKDSFQFTEVCYASQKNPCSLALKNSRGKVHEVYLFPAPQFPEFRMACKHQFFTNFSLIFLDLPAKLHWKGRTTHCRTINPSTPEIWLLILSSSCQTFPCKWVMRIWCAIKIKSCTW